MRHQSLGARHQNYLAFTYFFEEFPFFSAEYEEAPVHLGPKPQAIQSRVCYKSSCVLQGSLFQQGQVWVDLFLLFVFGMQTPWNTLVKGQTPLNMPG